MKERDGVEIKEVRENGIIAYDVNSILKSAPAKRHFKFLRKLWDEQKKTDRTKNRGGYDKREGALDFNRSF